MKTLSKFFSQACLVIVGLTTVLCLSNCGGGGSDDGEDPSTRTMSIRDFRSASKKFNMSGQPMTFEIVPTGVTNTTTENEISLVNAKGYIECASVQSTVIMTYTIAEEDENGNPLIAQLLVQFDENGLEKVSGHLDSLIALGWPVSSVNGQVENVWERSSMTMIFNFQSRIVTMTYTFDNTDYTVPIADCEDLPDGSILVPNGQVIPEDNYRPDPTDPSRYIITPLTLTQEERPFTVMKQ